MAIVAIIPARFGSSRLPGKPLSDLHGKPMIQWVHERVCQASRVERVLVATDDERILRVVRAFGGEAVLTRADHPTGTDRLAEAAAGTAAAIVVNVQGDEPMLDATGIDVAIAALLEDPTVDLSTISLPLTDPAEMLSSSVVKVVTDAQGNALYFSRAPIPWFRQGASDDPAASAQRAVAQALTRKHVGLYVYRREALLRFASLTPSPLEESEGLEQLRALHHGMKIRVALHAGESCVAVDTPEDLERVRALLRPFTETEGVTCPSTSS